VLEILIQHYGYLAIVVGTFFEGEAVLLLGGFAAHRGYLDLTGVMAAAFAGSLVGDWLYFEIGRRKGMAFLERRPAWQKSLARVLAMVHTHQTLLVLSFRFVYGIRTVTPFALGASGVSRARFVPLNLVSAALWASSFGALGYVLGNTIEVVLGDVRRYERVAFAAIVIAGLALWSWRRWHGRAASVDQGTLPE
jgi:membrane protein DedA with SNARE-associated domain